MVTPIFTTQLADYICHLIKQNQMKTILTFFTISLLAFTFACSDKTSDPAPAAPSPALSTNPANCKLAKLTFSNGRVVNYVYNAEGFISEMIDDDMSTKFIYTNGLLTNQKNAFLEMKFAYSGTDLSNIELLDNAGTKLGDYVVTLTPNKQINTLTVANPGSAFSSFNGVVTTFTYDAAGNNTLIEVKNGTTLIAKTEYSNFVNVRSHLTTQKGLIFSNYTSPLSVLEQAPFWKYPNTTPNAYKRSTILDENMQPTATMKVVVDYTYERVANESGLLKSRTVVGGGSATYEYTGCK